MDKETYETGLKIRSEVLGKEYVENSMKSAGRLQPAVPGIRQLQLLLGRGLGPAAASSQQERSMLNLAMISILQPPA